MNVLDYIVIHRRPAWCFLIVALGLWVAKHHDNQQKDEIKNNRKASSAQAVLLEKGNMLSEYRSQNGTCRGNFDVQNKIQNAGKATFGWSNNPKLSMLWILLKTYSKQWIMKVNKGILYNVWWLFKFGNQAWTAGLKVLIYVQAAFLTESKGWKGAQPRASKAA